MARHPSKPILDPVQCVLQKGRTYVQKDKYPQVMVFSTFVTEVDLLSAKWGGKKHRHNKGWLWMLATKDEILVLLDAVRDQVTPQSRLFPLLEWYQKERETAF